MCRVWALGTIHGGADEADRDDDILGEGVAKTARYKGADGVREHERRVHLRQDDLVDACIDELHLDVGVALAREMLRARDSNVQ